MGKKEHDPKECARNILPRLRPIVVSSQNRDPFLDVFEFSPNNVTQKHLGIIFGIFSINPSKKDAIYMTNHLASVIKKEYYSKPQRSAEESFESTLKIIDIILGEAFRNGKTSWLKNLDGIIAVIHKDTLHFSSCGKGNHFLFREGNLFNLTESTEEETEAPHPLKTFEDLSSGKVLLDDVFILCDRQLTSIFSPEQLKKEIALSPNKDSFFALLHTALINESTHSGAILAEIQTDNTPTPIIRSKTSDTFEIPSENLFGADAYSKKIAPPKEKQTKEDTEPLQEDTSYEDGGYYNQGRNIHIKESLETPSRPSTNPQLENLKERALITLETLETFTSQTTKKLQRTLQKNAWLYPKKKLQSPQKEDEPEQSQLEPLIKSLLLKGKNLAQDKAKMKSFFLASLKTLSQKKNLPSKEQILRLLEKKIKKQTPPPSTRKTKNETALYPWERKKSSSPVSTQSFQASALPNFSKIQGSFSSLNTRQKLYAILLLLSIIIIPFIWNKFTVETKKLPEPAQELTPSNIQVEPSDQWKDPWKNEKNIIFEEDLTFETISGIPPSIVNNTLSVSYWNNRILAVTPDAVVILNLSNNSMESYPPLGENEIFTHATFMKDLNLVFILTKNNTLFEFSPATQTYKKNKFPLPGNARPILMESYLTYLYIFDGQTNDILRFPRISSGFGNPTSWLKSESVIENPLAWNVEGNIFMITQNETIESYSRGRKTAFSLGSLSIPLEHPKDITFIKDHLLIIDPLNNRFLVSNQESGEIKTQYISKTFNEVKRILASQENSVYVENSSGDILKITLP